MLKLSLNNIVRSQIFSLLTPFSMGFPTRGFAYLSPEGFQLETIHLKQDEFSIQSISIDSAVLEEEQCTFVWLLGIFPKASLPPTDDNETGWLIGLCEQ